MMRHTEESETAICKALLTPGPTLPVAAFAFHSPVAVSSSALMLLTVGRLTVPLFDCANILPTNFLPMDPLAVCEVLWSEKRYPSAPQLKLALVKWLTW